MAVLAASTTYAQAPATWNGLPDRFQIDTGYFRMDASTKLRFNGPQGGSGEIDFEDDLGLNPTVDTFWLDGRWRLGRRHQVQLGFTRSHRNVSEKTLERDFVWGGETYAAGMSASSYANANILGGYYRFAVFRNDRFEIGPALGVGYLSLEAGIEARGSVSGPGGTTETRTLDRSTSTGSITGAIGGYAEAWPAKRLVLRGDFLYVKVSPENSEASVTDWRLAADWYFSRNVGVGVQYK